MTLTEFLLARIAADEAVAHKLAETDRRPLLSVALTVNHPARVLAECEAKRRIVSSLVQAGTDGVDYETGFGLDVAVRYLAAVYADHPDYDESWRA